MNTRVALLCVAAGAFVFSLSFPAGADDLAAGKKVYLSNCLVCHGARGDGKGAAGVALKPPPTDFTRASWWTATTPTAAANAIRDGVPGTSMRGFSNLSDADRSAVVKYLESFKAAP